jgi:Flp pilus assembly protein TadG
MNAARTTRNSFRKDRNGNVAMIAALAVIPMLAAVGAAVDYSRASNYHSKMNRAADAAALAAARERSASVAQKREIARKVFDASLGPTPDLIDIDFKLQPVGEGVRVEVSAKSKNQIMGVLGIPVSNVTTVAEAVTSVNATEVALVLDNTGSMRDDMAALRRAATQFAETLFAASNGDQLRMAVVPYVAAVNPGRNNLSRSQLDHNAESRWHGHWLENRTIGEMENCDPNADRPPVVSNPTPSTSTPVSNPTPSDPGPRDKKPKGKDRADAGGPLDGLAALAIELFGVKAARADITPATDAPNSGASVSPGPPFRVDGGTARQPDGFVWEKPCRLRNPPRISHFDLFERIQGVSWKGCVEARPEPFDVTDEIPSSARPDTLFVPYFWPDEPGRTDQTKFNNSYLNDGPTPQGWQRRSEWHDYANLFKYNRSNTSRIVETSPTTAGPNAACPDEVLPLTTSRPSVLQKIASLRHWDGGGTINSEGLMWGWRVLSPEPPFTEGAAYGSARKHLVLMSDGLNSFVENAEGPVKSDYTAYGYLRNGRLPSDWFSRGEDYLNERMRLACQNARAAGIRVMTILFRETDAATVNIMRDCASDPRLAFLASNEADLRRSFEEIASEISKLRLTK